MTHQTPNKFDPKQFEVTWSPASHDYTVEHKLTGTLYAVTLHALAVLSDDEYKQAVIATQHHIRQAAH